MKKNNFKYSLIAFYSSEFDFARDISDILVCSKTALDNGFYKNMQIVDATGTLYNVKDSR